MRLPTKCAVESMRMRAYQAGEDDAAESGCLGRVRSRSDVGDLPMFDTEKDVARQRWAAKPSERGVVARHSEFAAILGKSACSMLTPS